MKPDCSTTQPTPTRASSSSGTGRLASRLGAQPDGEAVSEADPAGAATAVPGPPGPAGAGKPPGASGAAAGASAVPGRLSDLLDDMAAEQPGGFHQQDGDQDHERDGFLVVAPAGQVPDHHRLDHAEQQGGDDGPADVPDPAEHGRDERLDPGGQSH